MIDHRTGNDKNRQTEAPEADDAASDPFLDALAAAEWDDEPYTDEQQALSEAGGEGDRRGCRGPYQVRSGLTQVRSGCDRTHAGYFTQSPSRLPVYFIVIVLGFPPCSMFIFIVPLYVSPE